MTNLNGLLAGLGNLKRIRKAGSRDSLAELCFRSGWYGLVAGQGLATALRTTAYALARVELGGIDSILLAAGGLSGEQAALVENRAFDHVAGGLDSPLRGELRSHLAEPFETGSAPSFVDLLCQQPRAGATRPGHARLIVLPPESHGEHCMMVAIYAVLLSPAYGADPEVAFIAGMAHHLHNAYLPDSGFAGEELLGELLSPVMEACRERALNQLEPELAAAVRRALQSTGNANNPEGRAFHAADVLDRVLQMKWHEDAARFTLQQAMGEMELVHAGPVQEFQMNVLREAGLC